MRFNLNCKLSHKLSRRSKACSSVGTGTSSNKMIPQFHLLNPPSTVYHNSFVMSTYQPLRILKFLLVLQGRRLLFNLSY